MDGPLTPERDSLTLLGSDGSPGAGAVVRTSPLLLGPHVPWPPDRPAHTPASDIWSLPLPYWHGDRPRNPRFAEACALHYMVLRAEARGRANGLMDAAPERA